MRCSTLFNLPTAILIVKPSFEFLPLRHCAFALLLGTAVLGGCGQIGPLTMPPKPINSATTTTAAPKAGTIPANAVTPVSNTTPFSAPSGAASETPVTPGGTTPSPESK